MFHADMRNDLEKGAPGVRKCGQVGLLWPIAVRSIPCVYAEIVDLEELLRKLITLGSVEAFSRECSSAVSDYSIHRIQYG